MTFSLPTQKQIAFLRGLKRSDGKPINKANVILRPSGLKAEILRAYEATKTDPECALVKLESAHNSQSP